MNTASLKLRDISTKYKLILKESLVDKIEYICRKVPNKEWSGVLFYNVEGSFEDKNLVLIGVDLFVQDIGTAGATEFEHSVDLGGYIVDHDLIGAQMGLIHSHNTMDTFFSSVDQDTLRTEGSERNHFLSLIVNNAGNYTAKITRKISYTERTLLSFSYNSFNEAVVTEKDLPVESQETVVEAFLLDIVKEGKVPVSFPEIDKILEDLNKKSSYPVYPKTTYGSYKGSLSTERVSAGRANIQQTLPFQGAQTGLMKKGTGIINKWEEGDEVYIESLDSYTEQTPPYETVHFDPQIVKSIVYKLISGSPFVPVDFNLEEAVKAMEENCSKVFKNLPSFTSWADGHLEYLITEASDPKVSDLGLSIDIEVALLAKDVSKELEKLPQNKWIEELKDLVEVYII